MDPKGVLPRHRTSLPSSKTRPARSIVLLTTFICCSLCLWVTQLNYAAPKSVKIPLHASEILDKCRLLNVKPGPPSDFYQRVASDRFVQGTKPTLITVRVHAHSRRPHSHAVGRMRVFGRAESKVLKSSQEISFWIVASSKVSVRSTSNFLKHWEISRLLMRVGLGSLLGAAPSESETRSMEG